MQSSLLYMFIFLPDVIEKYLWMSLLHEIDYENIMTLEKPSKKKKKKNLKKN